MSKQKALEDVLLEYVGKPRRYLFEYPIRADDSRKYIANAQKTLKTILDILGVEIEPEPVKKKEETVIEETLQNIGARVADCQSYNFGMTNADRLAHKDAPGMLRALSSVESLVEALEGVEQRYPNQVNASASTVADLLRAALAEVQR